jgi:hypothetical protein
MLGQPKVLANNADANSRMNEDNETPVHICPTLEVNDMIGQKEE